MFWSIPYVVLYGHFTVFPTEADKKFDSFFYAQLLSKYVIEARIEVLYLCFDSPGQTMVYFDCLDQILAFSIFLAKFRYVNVKLSKLWNRSVKQSAIRAEWVHEVKKNRYFQFFII